MRGLKMFLMVAVVVAFVLPATTAVAQDYEKVVCGKVLKVVGNTVVVRIDDTNKVHAYKNIDPDTKFVINGRDHTVYELREGMHACAYRKVAASAMVVVYIEEHEVATVVDTPDKHDAPPAPAPAPAPAALPHTASSLPLAGLAGLMLLALSAGIAVLRRV